MQMNLEVDKEIDDEEEEEEGNWGYEEYMQRPFLQCGKIINHKTTPESISYLFLKDPNTQEMEWIDSNIILSQIQKQAIADYWQMQNQIRNCGLPIRDSPVEILSPISVAGNQDFKCLYEVQTGDGIEILSKNDLIYGFQDQKALFRYFEKQLIPVI